jgi:hypothetical protein
MDVFIIVDQYVQLFFSPGRSDHRPSVVYSKPKDLRPLMIDGSVGDPASTFETPDCKSIIKS